MNCFCEARLCSSVNDTLKFADHFYFIQRALSGRINKNIQLACLKNSLFEFLLLALSLIGHQGWNKK